MGHHFSTTPEGSAAEGWLHDSHSWSFMYQIVTGTETITWPAWPLAKPAQASRLPEITRAFSLACPIALGSSRGAMRGASPLNWATSSGMSSRDEWPGCGAQRPLLLAALHHRARHVDAVEELLLRLPRQRRVEPR